MEFLDVNPYRLNIILSKNKNKFVEPTKMEHFQAAMKIQRAWRQYCRICPYCEIHDCNGFYSKFNCREMWDECDIIKLDTLLDGRY